MAEEITWAECRSSLEKVKEGADCSMILLTRTLEKLEVLMTAIKDTRNNKFRAGSCGR